jgi:hypothetical protein
MKRKGRRDVECLDARKNVDDDDDSEEEENEEPLKRLKPPNEPEEINLKNPVSFFVKKTANGNERFELVGTLHSYKNRLACPSDYNFYLGESKLELDCKRQISLTTHSIYLYDTYSRIFHLVMIKNDGMHTEIVDLKDEFSSCLFKLVQNKRIDVHIKSLEQTQSSLAKLTVEIYLRNNSSTNYITGDPSQTVRNVYTYEMHIVMTQLHFSHMGNDFC